MWTGLIIAILVLWSCVYVFKSVAPKTAYRLGTRIADWSAAQGWQQIATYVRPRAVVGCSGGCGCESTTAKQSDTSQQAVKWKL